MLPHASADAMSLHLSEIAKQVLPGAHALVVAMVVLDGAGRHELGGRPRVPDNVSSLPRPPYAPELNLVELIWRFLRQNQLSNRVFDGCDAIVDACCSAWNALIPTPERITSIATRSWAKVNT